MFSSNVKKILAVFETFKSLSAGVLDERVGAAVHEEGTLRPQLGYCEDTNLVFLAKFFAPFVVVHTLVSRQDRSLS